MANGTRGDQSGALAIGVAGSHSHSAGSDLDPLIGDGHVLLNNHSTGHIGSSGRGQGHADNQIVGAILGESSGSQRASSSHSGRLINDLDEHGADRAVSQLEPDLIVCIVSDGSSSAQSQLAIGIDVVDLAVIGVSIVGTIQTDNAVLLLDSANSSLDVRAVMNNGYRTNGSVERGEVIVTSDNTLAVVSNTGDQSPIRPPYSGSRSDPLCEGFLFAVILKRSLQDSLLL